MARKVGRPSLEPSMPRPVLITAGATRNTVDAIRYISAHAGGATGVAIAAGLAAVGPVTFFGNPEALLRAPGWVEKVEYGGTLDLEAKMRAWVGAHPGGVVVHSAAVGDYIPVVAPGKIPSGADEITIRLLRGPKILDQIKGWDPRCLLVSFKAAGPETDMDGLAAIATTQRARTGSDLVFANVLGKLNQALLIADADGVTPFAERGAAIAALIARIQARVAAAV
jgi:phosphopantothenoylcysteine decarboxylase/phosphopantothenate--cysteine ligase